MKKYVRKEAAQLPNPVDVSLTRRAMDAIMAFPQPGKVRAYLMGRVFIIAVQPHEQAGWMLHMEHPDRYPSWAEVVKARQALVPEGLQMALMLAGAEMPDNVLVLAELPPLDLLTSIYAGELATLQGLSKLYNDALMVQAAGPLPDDQAEQLTGYLLAASGALEVARMYLRATVTVEQTPVASAAPAESDDAPL